MDTPNPAASGDRVVWRADLVAGLHVHSGTIRRWILAGKLPEPDVDLSLKTKGWRLSTLHAAGIRIP